MRLLHGGSIALVLHKTRAPSSPKCPQQQHHNHSTNKNSQLRVMNAPASCNARSLSSLHPNVWLSISLMASSVCCAFQLKRLQQSLKPTSSKIVDNDEHAITHHIDFKFCRVKHADTLNHFFQTLKTCFVVATNNRASN